MVHQMTKATHETKTCIYLRNMQAVCCNNSCALQEDIAVTVQALETVQNTFLMIYNNDRLALSCRQMLQLLAKVVETVQDTCLTICNNDGLAVPCRRTLQLLER